MFQKKRFHLLDPTSSLVFTVGVVQLHTDLTNVVALPVQPEHLVTELADASGESFELRLVLVVDLLHLLLHVQEVGGHVALHAARDTGVHVVHRSQVPLVLSGLDFHEAVVMTGLLDRSVHRKGVVEVDVAQMLRDGVLAQTDDLLHSLQIVRVGTQLLQGLLSEVDVDVHVLRVVDVVIVRGIVYGRVY